MKPMVKFAVLTGLRKENILGLKWNHVDFTNRILHIPETKNDDPLKFPLSQPALEILKAIEKHSESDYVFYQSNGRRYQNINFDHLYDALQKAKISDFHFHDLRHTAASHLVMGGVDLATVKEILGHKDIKMTLRYTHLAPDHKRNAVETLGSFFDGHPYGHQGKK